MEPSTKSPDAIRGTDVSLMQRLAKAKAGTEVLNAATDILTHRIELTETSLVALNLGVYAHVDLGPHGAADAARLTFCKGPKTGWGLYVDLQNQLVPLKSAAREFRILAAEQLPALVSKLIESVELTTARVQDASENLTRFLTEFHGAGPLR